MELDRKKNNRDIGRDARESIRKIENLHKNNHPRFKIVQTSDWSDPRLQHLQKVENDHQIIVLAHNLMVSGDFKEVKLISFDTTVRILGRDLGIITEEYESDTVRIDETKLKEIEIPSDMIVRGTDSYEFTLPSMDDYSENEGVVCWSDWNGNLEPSNTTKWGAQFTAIKKGESFHVVDNNISLMSLIPYSMNGGSNWEQYIAMKQLLDPSIKLSFLIGGAGTGKTVLALAAALEMRSDYRNILVTRPMIPLEDEDRLGFLPGDINDKMSPWLKPIWRSLSFIGHQDKKNQGIIQRVRERNKLEIEPLDYIRGMTFVRDILIIDEAQNLTPHQIKTIITRAGKGAKLIFTGDLGQIDRKKKINADSCGLAYASVKMANQPMVSVTHFKETVRSPLAHLAERLL